MSALGSRNFKIALAVSACVLTGAILLWLRKRRTALAVTSSGDARLTQPTRVLTAEEEESMGPDFAVMSLLLSTDKSIEVRIAA